MKSYSRYKLFFGICTCFSVCRRLDLDFNRSTYFVNVNSFEDFIEPNLFSMFYYFLILKKTKKNICLIEISDCHYQANKYI